MGTYLVTITRGLDDLARAAARKAIDLPLETTYLGELEQCPALPYHRLLLYRDACQNISRRVLHETYSSRPTPGVSRPVELEPVATRTNAPGPLAPRSTSPASASSGQDDTCVSSSDSLRPRHLRSKSAWLPAYVTSIFEQTSSRPGTATQKEKMLFVDATTAGNAWCRQCQLLALDLLDLRTRLRSIPAMVRGVSIYQYFLELLAGRRPCLCLAWTLGSSGDVMRSGLHGRTELLRDQYTCVCTISCIGGHYSDLRILFLEITPKHVTVSYGPTQFLLDEGAHFQLQNCNIHAGQRYCKALAYSPDGLSTTSKSLYEAVWSCKIDLRRSHGGHHHPPSPPHTRAHIGKTDCLPLPNVRLVYESMPTR